MKSNRRTTPHTTTGLWLIALAVPLFVVLGVLQFQWLSALSERDSESRHTRLAADLQRFGADVDRELLLAYVAFRLDVDAIAARDAREAVQRFRAWQAQSRFPGLIRDLWIAEQVDSTPFARNGLIATPLRVPSNGRQTVNFRIYALTGSAPISVASHPMAWRYLHLDVGRTGFVASSLPPALESLQRRFASPSIRDARGIDDRDPFSHPLNEETFSICVPLAVEINSVVPSRSVMRFAILQLDRAYIVNELLPTLARRYFATSPTSTDLEYQLAVVRASTPHEVVYASHPARSGGVPDASAPLFGIRPPATRKLNYPFVVPAGMGVFGTVEQPPREYWQVRATHRTGSLEAFAAQSRRQNLLASGALLALLGGSLMLMLVALRRARELTRQQMEFVSVVSHELRTAVAVVSMTGANLADGLVHDPERVRHYGRLIHSEGRRLNETTEQVLSLARIESARVQATTRVEMAGVIRRAVDAMRAQTDAMEFSCQMDLEPHLPPVLGEAASLELAVRNLLGNALKYSDRQREIRISARTHGAPDAARVLIAVADSGIGIDADELSLIFEPFRRGRAALDRNLPGMGLGLHLVTRILQAHGGTVRVRSEPGLGSTFTLDLPAALP